MNRARKFLTSVTLSLLMMLIFCVPVFAGTWTEHDDHTWTYLNDDGEVICDHLSPKKLLDIMRHACKGKTQPDMELCKQFNKETKDGRSMGRYSELLHSAIGSIISVKE